MKFMNVLKKLNEDLESSDLNHKIEAINYIGEEVQYRELVPKLLDMLSNEEDIDVLNALAVNLGKLGCNEAVPILIEYIRNPNFKDKRGSFIYGLLGLDCKKYFLDFVQMICDGNFEVFDQSFLIFESIVDQISFDIKLRGKGILEKQLKVELSKPESKYPQYERIKYINDALELLK